MVSGDNGNVHALKMYIKSKANIGLVLKIVIIGHIIVFIALGSRLELKAGTGGGRGLPSQSAARAGPDAGHPASPALAGICRGPTMQRMPSSGPLQLQRS